MFSVSKQKSPLDNLSLKRKKERKEGRREERKNEKKRNSGEGYRAVHRSKGKAEKLGLGKDVYQSHLWGFR